MTEEQAARKIESMMREDPELAQCISEGLAEQAVSAVEGWLEKNGHTPCDEEPAGMGAQQFVILPTED